MTLTLATHSPYIINHLNLLLKAFDKGVKIENAALDYHKTEVYVVEHGMVTVSYTHLDVYKRQSQTWECSIRIFRGIRILNQI